MFCPNCGNQLAEGAAFCGQCGTKVEAQPAPQQPAYEIPQQPAYEAPQQPAYEAPQPTYQQPAYTAPQPTYQQPVYTAPVQNQNNPELNSLATNTMIFGIVSLASALMAGVPGIVFSVLAKNKASEFVTRTGSLFGKAKVGANLAKAGLPVGIVMTVFYFICFLVGFFNGL